MGDKRPYKPRKPGAGRKPLKPDYDAVAILHEQMQAAVALYNSNNSLQTIADTLSLNPIKVRKLLITQVFMNQKLQMQSIPLLKQNREYLIKKHWKRWQQN